MTAPQSIFRVRRNYNRWVANETLEDYALRFTAKSARRWSAARVSHTALGAISFLALEAIGGAITLSYGFSNTALAIAVVGFVIFATGLPISYYATKYGVDVDLLTRGSGFGYIGSTITSLIYASFTFIFFALEAAILALALKHLFGVPLSLGYLLSSFVVIPIVTHGITLISRFQLWTQPLWIVLQLLPFIYIGAKDIAAVQDWTQFSGVDVGPGSNFDLLLFGAASAVIFSLIAQIGEQVDFLRFLPVPQKKSSPRWWCAMIAGGPGWIGVGALKIFAGSFLAVLALQHGIPASEASDPTQMYRVAFGYISSSPEFALALAGIFVILSQLKINVTNAYAGSIAWSNFFARLTHNHPGRVVWVVFNVVIALLLMELGVYEAIKETLGVYAIVAVGWVGTLVADLVINKPLGLSPKTIEFRRAYLYDINPVGVGSMVLACLIGISAHFDTFNETAQALACYLTLASTLLISPTIAWLTQGRYYIAREPVLIPSSDGMSTCCICEHRFENEDIAQCPAYDGPICSLCCSLDARCQDRCKPRASMSEQMLTLLGTFLPAPVLRHINTRIGHFLSLTSISAVIIALMLAATYAQIEVADAEIGAVVDQLFWKQYFVLLIIAGVAGWLFVLTHESRHVAQEESNHQTELLQREIAAHERTDLELQQAKELAEAANLAKSRYLTGISHELRSPLNAVMGYAQLLDKDTGVSDKQREAVGVILRGSEHLADLIEGLLDISKIEAGRLELHRNEVRLPQLMDQIVHMFQLQAEAKGLAFHYRCHSPLPNIVVTDEKRLRQVLINLLSNAIKFTPRGSVDLNLRYRNQVAVFSVTDSGIGIAPDKLETIFQPFEQIREAHQPSSPGTGLGLTITRFLAEIMGGEITVTSVPGKGSTFTVSLLLSVVAEPKTEVAVNRDIIGYQGDTKTVLVADDDPRHRALLEDLLAPLGFELILAGDAQQCLSLMTERLTDICLLDVAMPGMDGWTLAKALRRLLPAVPIVMISADAREGVPLDHYGTNIRSAATAEAAIHVDYLIKPVKVDQLLDCLARRLQIDWIVRTPTLLPKIQAPLGSGDLPHPARVRQLSELAEIGHLQGLRAQLATLREDRGTSLAFINYLDAAISEVRMERIIRLRDMVR